MRFLALGLVLSAFSASSWALPVDPSFSLFGAVESGSVGSVQILLALGADPNDVDDSGFPVLLRAAQHESTDILRLLVASHADPLARAWDGETALHALFNLGDLDFWVPPDAVKFLLSTRIDVNAKDILGETALHRAARKVQEPNSISVLAQAGADVNAPNAQGTVPLHLAMSPLVAQALLDAGARLDATDSQGRNVLHVLATRYGEANTINLIHLFVKAGLSINSRTLDGRTPLHCLAQASPASRSTAAALIALGADLTAKDQAGETPFDLAQKSANGVADLLK